MFQRRYRPLLLQASKLCNMLTALRLTTVMRPGNPALRRRSGLVRTEIGCKNTGSSRILSEAAQQHGVDPSCRQDATDISSARQKAEGQYHGIGRPRKHSVEVNSITPRTFENNENLCHIRFGVVKNVCLITGAAGGSEGTLPSTAPAGLDCFYRHQRDG